MISSDPASGFPQIMKDIFRTFDIDDLLSSRLVSKTFYDCLMEDKLYWNLAFTKIYSIALENNGDVEFPDFLETSFQTKEEMRNGFNKKWLDAFNKIKEKATIQQVIQLCHFMKTPENYANFYMEVNSLTPVNPIMWVYLRCLLVRN